MAAGLDALTETLTWHHDIVLSRSTAHREEPLKTTVLAAAFEARIPRHRASIPA